MIPCALQEHDSSHARMGDQRNRALTEHRDQPFPTWGAAPGYGIIAFQAKMPESLRRPKTTLIPGAGQRPHPTSHHRRCEQCPFARDLANRRYVIDESV